MKRFCETVEMDWEILFIVPRLLELKELFPHWSLSEFSKQLSYEGYQTAQGKPFTKEQIKRIFDCEDFYIGIFGDGDVMVPGRYTAIY